MRIFELFEDDLHYYIVSELIEGGELYDRIVKAKVFSEVQAAQLLNQILLAINYMHNQKITHRDLKPENILMESKELNNLEIKITDFGFAAYFDPKEGLKEILGSPLYMAPEIIDGQQYDQKVDIWSFGVIAYILLSGRPPFKGKNKQEILYHIQNFPLSFEHKNWQKVSKSAIDFVRKALSLDQKKRWSAEQLLNHSWLVSMQDRKQIDATVKLDIATSLLDFKNTTTFQ